MDILTGIAVAIAFASVDTVQCWQPPVDLVVNLGDTPGYAIQYVVPNHLPARLVGFGILNNDGSTTWPSAGFVVTQPDTNGLIDFPTPAELDSLQIHVIPASADTTVLEFRFVTDYVVLTSPDEIVGVILQVPSGTLSAVGSGPGWGSTSHPGVTSCSYFTTDGGTTWQSFTDASGDIIEWAWGVGFEPVVPTDVLPFVRRRSWTAMKKVYR